MPHATLQNHFKIFTRREGEMGASLIISAHGGRVPPESRHARFARLPFADDVFWLLAPEMASMPDQPYDEIMEHVKPLVMDVRTHYPQASKYRQNMSLHNMLLSRYKHQQGRSESERIEEQVTRQALPLFDFMTVRKSAGTVTLDRAFEAVRARCQAAGRRYNYIAAHFCNVRRDRHDVAGHYQAGYVPF